MEIVIGDISFYGIDDELKNDQNSIYKTQLNTSSELPVINYSKTTYLSNQDKINTSNVSIATYNYNSNYYIEPTTSNIAFNSGEINLTSYNSSNYSNIATLFKTNPPWGVYLAEDFRGTTLFDISGNGRHAATTGTITKVTASGNGASAPITYITGGPNDTIVWPPASISANFTILGLTRYAGGNTQRILQAVNANWLQGHLDSKRGQVYYGDGYKTSTTTVGTLFDWLCCIGKNSGAGTTPGNILLDGVASGTATGGIGSSVLTVNGSSTTTTQDSDFALAAVMIWDKHLTDTEMVLLNNLINDYKAGIVNPRLFFPAFDYNYAILKNLDGTIINPVVWYKFDNSTNLGLDTIGNNNLTNNANSVSYNTSFIIKGSGSGSFNGANNTYLAKTSGFYDIDNKDFTISFWSYNTLTTQTNNRWFFNIGNAYILGVNYQLGLYRTSTGSLVVYGVYDNLTFTTTERYLNAWLFTTITYRQSNKLLTLYLNGVAVASKTNTINYQMNKEIKIGSIATGVLAFQGYIDDFRIYSQVLTQEQVSQLYYGRHIDKSYPIIKRNNTTLNPLVWYKFDDSTNLGLDTMGLHNLTNNATTPYNGTDTIKGIGSVSFNGTTQYLNKASAFNLNNKDWSISCWIKRGRTNTSERFIRIGNSSVGNELIAIGITSTNFAIVDFNGVGNNLTGTQVLATNIWYHIVFTFNNTSKTRNLYLNGVLHATNTSAGQVINTNNTFEIGRTPFYQGLMDDVRIYEYELTANEVQELYRGRVEVVTTITNKTLYSNDNLYLWNNKTINGVNYLLESQLPENNLIINNTKRFKFNLINKNFKSSKLTNNARLVIKSVYIPNIINKTYLQSKGINQIMLRLKGISNNYLTYDSSKKGNGLPLIFSLPLRFNTQGYGVSYQAGAVTNPSLTTIAETSRLNTDNGLLFINQNTNHLYSFPINEDFIRTGEFEFELIYEMSSCIKNHSTIDAFIEIQQTLDFATDKDSLESFNINFILKDLSEEDTRVYEDKKLLNNINNFLFDY